jgi:hypothetical protein
MRRKNDITWGQAIRADVPPDQKVNKAEKQTYFSINMTLHVLTKIVNK